jgi:hypothetical protein
MPRQGTGKLQGLALVHFQAQFKRFAWERGCIKGLFRGCLGSVRGYEGLSRLCIVSGERLKLSSKMDECKPLIHSLLLLALNVADCC